MNRREFLTSSRTKTAAKARSSRNLATGLTPYAGAWTINEVAHLLKRTMFGARKSDIDFFLGLSVGNAVDELLKTSALPAPPVRDYGLITLEEGTFDDLGVAIGQTWINDLNVSSDEIARGNIDALRIQSLRKWWVGLMLNQKRSIEEKLLLFWHHHFSVQREEVESSRMLYYHHDLLRRNLMGNVRELTKLVTVDPAMLKHLNGHLNAAKAPDENYARELQELMTIGKGDDSGYTEDDVMEAARVLTGWRIDTDTFMAYFDVDAHDKDSKRFSAFYNNTTISGSTDGMQEITQLVDMIFSAREASRFFCRKLYKWFVYSNIDENTEANVISPLADILRANNFEIKPVLEALFKSEHFFDVQNQACNIKSPYDMIVGLMRDFNVSIPDYTAYATGYPIFFSVYIDAAEMQQNLLQPPDVSGWPAYHQDPMHYELWVNSNSLPKRADFTDKLITDNIIDVRSFAAATSMPWNPDRLIEDIDALLFRYPLSATSRAYVKNRFLLNNTGDNNIWTNAWNTNNNALINPALRELFKFLLNLPEFHLS
ncbi:MAG: DUF1800 domain-containing protein [Chitinophagaceae bacterium]|nr:DUF1800 domain-containing protein [Chitinophagaceae bacterium]